MDNVTSIYGKDSYMHKKYFDQEHRQTIEEEKDWHMYPEVFVCIKNVIQKIQDIFTKKNTIKD